MIKIRLWKDTEINESLAKLVKEKKKRTDRNNQYQEFKRASYWSQTSYNDHKRLLWIVFEN